MQRHRISIAALGRHSECVLFGIAFLLLETKLVTQMSLLWRATWISSAVSAPVFFASICVDLRFQQRDEPYLAFGWNLTR